MTAEAIAVALGNAQKEGGSWRCNCPVHGGSSLILSDAANGGLRIKCWGGCNPRKIRAELRRRKLHHFTSNGATRPETRGEHEGRVRAEKAKRQAKTRHAQWYWDTSLPAANTIAETYLASRLILDSPPPTLRFCPAVFRPKARIKQPHIIALIEHEGDGVIGAHFIALNPVDARIRVTGDDRKWTKGRSNGGLVRLFPAGPALAIAQSAADALAFKKATRTPCWAAISADGIRNFVPPPLTSTQTILLLEDQDSNQVGQRAVADACSRLAALGYQVAVVRPKVRKDLNDALLKLGPGATLFTMEEYQQNRAGDWYPRCIIGDGSKPLSNSANPLLALREDPAWRGVLGYDELAWQATVRRPIPGAPSNGGGKFPRPLDDFDISYTQQWLQRAGLPLTGRDTTQALEAVAHENAYHPVRDYLNGLVWDGVERLDDWLTDCLGVEKTEYAMRIGRMFLIAMVARAFQPGVQADYMLILEGEQRTRKSTACRALGSQWFSDDLPGNVGSRDAALHLRGHWLIEISELHSFSRSEIDTVKAFLTRRIDSYRPTLWQEGRAPRATRNVHRHRKLANLYD